MICILHKRLIRARNMPEVWLLAVLAALAEGSIEILGTLINLFLHVYTAIGGAS
jgi:hypothetical protein